MSQIQKTIKKSKLIIGEGKEDEMFFSKLIEYLEINDIQVDSYGGKDNLNNYLKTLHLIPGFSNLRSLGITRDADDSFDYASKSIEDSLIKYKLKEIENLKIEKFILPNNSSEGMLEDLCLESIDTDEISCIESFFQCMEKSTGRKSNKISKAKIYAWLSTQEHPDKRLGAAVQAGYINWDNEAFKELTNFIKNL
ncbi:MULTISPECIES: DUF3226 domain-containing protein [unclassified Okeania]|uniref:DUF3226 domain-containing protein n=1 Tax=unclassified Okeania TaxID=2634635 RepID=UPI0013BDCB0B|nr:MULTISPECIES: DUF3226 domain-containing protein [unclassified Okeania]NES75522.1 hypothetical protein [Okeania sp. SIO1H4]NET14141.1 hypothetical protein [Okeania sp. SIO1H6]NET17949.1 hypothetical protein [Okeania sp. SIO1H5]NET92809.1 hypothetical protein [Okeania sp. SIO1H2]